MNFLLIDGHDIVNQGCINSKYRVMEHKVAVMMNNYISNYFLLKYKDMPVRLCVDHLCHKFTKSTIFGEPGEQKVDLTSLMEKVQAINQSEIPYAVSMHLNAFDRKAHGFEILYCSDGGKALASAVSDNMDEFMGEAGCKTFRNRGIKERKDLIILRKTKPITILIEPFFLDNDDEFEFWFLDRTNWQILTLGLATSLEKAFKEDIFA